MKKYTLKELDELQEDGYYTWWDRADGTAHANQNNFNRAVHYRMISEMCLDNQWHPDYAGGVIDKHMYTYYVKAHEIIFWRINEKK